MNLLKKAINLYEQLDIRLKNTTDPLTVKAIKEEMEELSIYILREKGIK